MPAVVPSYEECYQFTCGFKDDPYTYLFNWIDPVTLAVEKLVAYDPVDGTRTTHYLGRYDTVSHTGDFPLATQIAEDIATREYFGSVMTHWYRNPEEKPRPWKRRSTHTGRVLVDNPNPKAGCNYCVCQDCNGGVLRSYHGCFVTIKMADGTRMCDVCYNYPPCGGYDCEEFELTHRCRHRPSTVPYPEPMEVKSYLDFFGVEEKDLPKEYVMYPEDG